MTMNRTALALDTFDLRLACRVTRDWERAATEMYEADRSAQNRLIWKRARIARARTEAKFERACQTLEAMGG
jgi:hypothetical protein